jgi:hypothetical protein
LAPRSSSRDIMADTQRDVADAVPEKSTTEHTTEHHVDSPDASTHEGQTGEIPKGWKYKQIKIGPITLPWFASPQVQLVMVAFVCFLCPGESESSGMRQLSACMC